MPENKSDEIFRDKLQGHSSPVPEYMWQRVQPKKGKDRKMIFFWLGSLMAGLGLASLIYFSRGHFTQEGLTGPRQSRNANPVGSAIATKSSGSPAIASSTGRSSGSPLFTSRISRAPASTLINTRSINTRTTGSRSIPAAPLPVSRQKTHYQPDELPIDNRLSSIQPVQKEIPPLFRSLPRTIASPFIPSSASSISSCPVVKTRKFPVYQRKNNWWLDLYGSPDLPINHISSTDDPGFAQYVERSQHMQLSYTLGLRINKSFNKHFSGTIGFQYSRINAITISDTLGSRGPEHLNGIDIPLLIGYRWENDYFQTTINSGIILNIYSWYKGQFFNIPDDSLYKRNTGISLYLGLNLARQITDKLTLFTEPYFRYRLSNMGTTRLPFERRIDVAGLSLGLRYYLRRKGTYRKEEIGCP